MENNTRQQRAMLSRYDDQENVNLFKGKSGALPTKNVGLSVRGALGEINTNTQIQRDATHGKLGLTANDVDKKSVNNRGITRGNTYSHVQSKIDTGLTTSSKPLQASKPVLRRQESTAGHAIRAVVGTRALLKETHNKQNENKESINLISQYKNGQEIKPIRVPATKIAKGKNKPVIKESTESLRKLKLVEQTKTPKCLEHNVNTQELSPKIPNDVVDIDAKDDSLFHMTDYIRDIFRYLTELEKKYAIAENFLENQSVINGKMRSTLIDWLVEVHQQFSLELETFHLTVAIIDRYLQETPNVQKDRLQLVGITAMFLASKYEEIYAPNVSDFVFVTDNAYSKTDVFQCERDIASKLDYCFAKPIPISFLRRYIKAAKGNAKQHNLGKYFVDLSLMEAGMAHYRPSELAAAAVCLAAYVINGVPLNKCWTPTLVYYTGYKFQHIDPIIRKMAGLVVNAGNSKFKAVYNKYSEKTLSKVAMLPQLKSEAFQLLTKTPSPSAKYSP